MEGVDIVEVIVAVGGTRAMKAITWDSEREKSESSREVITVKGRGNISEQSTGSM